MTDRGKLTERRFQTKYFGVPLERILPEENEDTALVRGFFTSDQRDEAGDIITRGATERAIEKYKRWGNVRYMHLPKPAGKITRIGTHDGLAWNEVEIEVIDPQSIFEVRNGLLTALSVGIYMDFDDIEFLEDGGLVINDYTLCELSLVDHPANYDAYLTSIKGALHAFTALPLDVQAQLQKEGVNMDGTILEELPRGGAYERVQLEDEEPQIIEGTEEVEIEGEITAEKDLEQIEDTEVDETQDVEGDIEDELPGVEKDAMSIGEPEDDNPEELKTVIPYKSHGKADEGTAWSRPNLEDFTGESWEDLSDSEKKRIGAHFTYSKNWPPKTYGDLKLPHHQASNEGVGPAVWNGVKNAVSRLPQSSIPSGEQDGCRNHLYKHYEEFDKEPPEKELGAEEQAEIETKEEPIHEEKSPACRQSDETVEECVERKIPELIDEGMDQDQAVAAAHNICSEPCKSCPESDVKEVAETVETENTLETLVKALQAEIEQLKHDFAVASGLLKVVAEALQGQDEQSNDNDEQRVNVEEMQRQLEEAKERNLELKAELDLLKKPAERKGHVLETELPEAIEDEEEEQEENINEKPLTKAVRRHLESRFTARG